MGGYRLMVAKFVIILVDVNLSNMNKTEQNSKEVAETLLSTEENIKQYNIYFSIGKKIRKIQHLCVWHKICLLYRNCYVSFKIG
jgi:hypothetical protein